MTVAPSRSRASTRCEPMNPAPPVTSAIFLLPFFTSQLPYRSSTPSHPHMVALAKRRLERRLRVPGGCGSPARTFECRGPVGRGVAVEDPLAGGPAEPRSLRGAAAEKRFDHVVGAVREQDL